MIYIRTIVVILVTKIGNKTLEEVTKEVNDKMDELIKNEKFEEAAKLRDYMLKKSIKRIK